MRVGEGQWELSAPDDKLRADLRRAEGELQGAGQRGAASLNQVGVAGEQAGGRAGGGMAVIAGGLDKVGISSVAVGTAIGTLASRGIQMATDALGDMVGEVIAFDRAMNNVNSIAQVGEGTFRRMSSAVIELSTELPMSASNLAEGLYNIQSSGFAGEQGLVVLEAAAKAASAGLTDTNISAAGLTAVLNSYGLEATDAAGISDIMFETVNRGVLTFAELSANIGSTASLAAPLGVSFEEVSAALALMTRNGVNAAEATTSIEAVMRSILKPSTEAMEMAGELGIQWDTAALSSKGLVGVLGDMVERTGGSHEAMATLLGDARAIRGAMVLAAGGVGAFETEIGYMEDSAGATSAVLGYQEQGLAFQIELLKNQLMAMAQEIGQTVVPALVTLFDTEGPADDFADGVTESAFRLRDSFAGVQEATAQTAKKLEISYNEAHNQIRDVAEALGISLQDAAVKVSAGYTLLATESATSIDSYGDVVRLFGDTTAAAADAVNLEAAQMAADLAKLREAAITEMSAMVSGMAGLFESDESVRDAWQALIDRMDDPYTEAERKADVFSENTINNIRAAIASGDPDITADTYLLVNNMLSQIELLEPGALAGGEAVPVALREGMNAEVGALIDYIEREITGESLSAMTLDEAKKLGLDGIWLYAQGMRQNAWQAHNEATSVAGQVAAALAFDASEGGRSIVGTWLGGMTGAWAAEQYKITGIVGHAARIFGTSLPSAGPLQHPDSGGRSIVQAWVGGMLAERDAVGAAAGALADAAHRGLMLEPGVGSLGAGAGGLGGFGGSVTVRHLIDDPRGSLAGIPGGAPAVAQMLAEGFDAAGVIGQLRHEAAY